MGMENLLNYYFIMKKRFVIVVLLHLFPNGILKTVSNVTSVHTFVLTLLSVRSF